MTENFFFLASIQFNSSKHPFIRLFIHSSTHQHWKWNHEMIRPLWWSLVFCCCASFIAILVLVNKSPSFLIAFSLHCCIFFRFFSLFRFFFVSRLFVCSFVQYGQERKEEKPPVWSLRMLMVMSQSLIEVKCC